MTDDYRRCAEMIRQADGLLITANAGEGSSAQASQQQMAKTIMAGFGQARK